MSDIEEDITLTEVEKVTVIGGSGFIGTRLCQLLEGSKIDFEILDKRPSRVYAHKCRIVNIHDLDALSSSMTGDRIIHLAAVHRDDVEDKKDYYRTNCEGTANICRVAEAKGITNVVFTSSVAVYGSSANDTSEDQSPDPTNDYGKSKLEAEKILLEWYASDQSGRSLSIIRPTVVFGEGNRGNVYNLLCQIAKRNAVLIGRGQNKKSMAYVENVAEAILHLSKRSSGLRLYNYVDKPDFQMNELIGFVRSKLKEGNVKLGREVRIPIAAGLAIGSIFDRVSWLTGKRSPISRSRVEKFVSNTTFTTGIFKMEGITPSITLQEGIERTILAEFIERNDSMIEYFTE